MSLLSPQRSGITASDLRDMPNTHALLRQFVAEHDKLNSGAVSQTDALQWWSQGWVVRQSIDPERWALTDEGRHLISWPY